MDFSVLSPTSVEEQWGIVLRRLSGDPTWQPPLTVVGTDLWPAVVGASPEIVLPPGALDTAAQHVFAKTRLPVLQRGRSGRLQVFSPPQTSQELLSQDLPTWHPGPPRTCGGVLSLLWVPACSGPGGAGRTRHVVLPLPPAVHPPSPPTVLSQETRGAPHGALRPQPPSQGQQEGGSGEEQRPLLHQGHLFTPPECAQFRALPRGDFRADAVQRQEGVLAGRPQGEFLKICVPSLTLKWNGRFR